MRLGIVCVEQERDQISASEVVAPGGRASPTGLSAQSLESRAAWSLGQASSTRANLTSFSALKILKFSKMQILL